jgi:hypothetical protein
VLETFLSRIARAALGAAALAGLGVAAPASAEPLPRPDQIGAPAALLREISDILADRTADGASRTRRLDVLLAQIGEPSQARGFVQFLRAIGLQSANRIPEARVAADEAIRLLPGYSGPLLLDRAWKPIPIGPGSRPTISCARARSIPMSCGASRPTS